MRRVIALPLSRHSSTFPSFIAQLCCTTCAVPVRRQAVYVKQATPYPFRQLTTERIQAVSYQSVLVRHMLWLQPQIASQRSRG